MSQKQQHSVVVYKCHPVGFLELQRKYLSKKTKEKSPHVHGKVIFLRVEQSNKNIQTADDI